jgi:small-conductance mechanosensitive channel
VAARALKRRTQSIAARFRNGARRSGRRRNPSWASMDLSWIAEFWAAYVPEWAVALLGLASAVVFALIAHAIAFRVVNRLLRRRKSSVAASFVERIRWPTRFILLAFFITAVLPALRIAPELSLLLQRIASLSLIAMVGWLAISVVNLGGDILTLRYNIEIADNLAARRVQTQLRILKRTVNLVLLVVTVSIMLMTIPQVREFGVSLFASAGVAGIAVGFAAKSTIANLLAGLQIALAQPIRIDDVVVVEKEWGRVEEITSTYVVVRIWDERRLVVPLSYFIEKPFQNWTRRAAEILGEVFWYLDYTAPIDAMRTKLDEWVRESAHWDKKVALIQVTNTDKTTIEVRALVSAANSSANWDLRCELRERMITYLREQHPDCLPKIRQEQYKVEPPRAHNGADRDAERMGGEAGGAPGVAKETPREH